MQVLLPPERIEIQPIEIINELHNEKSVEAEPEESTKATRNKNAKLIMINPKKLKNSAKNQIPQSRILNQRKKPTKTYQPYLIKWKNWTKQMCCSPRFANIWKIPKVVTDLPCIFGEVELRMACYTKITSSGLPKAYVWISSGMCMTNQLWAMRVSEEQCYWSNNIFLVKDETRRQLIYPKLPHVQKSQSPTRPVQWNTKAATSTTKTID